MADARAVRRSRRPLPGWPAICNGISETAENIAHGLSQAFMKRGPPRAAMRDNGEAMTATEIAEGLVRLGVLHETTLPYSP
jgi:transposase InsO family protein